VILPKDKHPLDRARLFLVAIAILLGNPAFSKGILESGNDYILACRAFTSRQLPRRQTAITRASVTSCR
jgi:hypothetical protein